MLLWCLQVGDTALILAFENGHTEVVKHLVALKADVNAKDDVITTLT